MPLPKLLDVLQERFPDSSKTTLRKMLQADRVLVNGDTEHDARRAIGTRDRVEVASRSGARGLDPRIRILHQDESLVVIEKDAGLLTMASPTEPDETAEALLNAYFGARPGQSRVLHVHRLDYDSSGVLVFARDANMRERLKELFATHDIDRIYVAIVHGAMAKPSGTFRSFLAEDQTKQVKSVADIKKGKEAITHYKTIASGPRYSMLEVTLETGRRNQIRVHLSESGHPIVGDKMYGKGRDNPIGRLALHAQHLGFIHPATKKPMSFTVPLPEEFRKLKL